MNRVTVKLEPTASKTLDKMLRDFSRSQAIKVMQAAQRRAPVDTGALRDSIQVTEDKDGFTVGSDLPYSLAVELGTRYRTPVRYLSLALDEVENANQ